MSSLLEVKDLTTQFSQAGRSVTVVNQLCLTVEKGETVGIVGESGCGKSVTSLSIMRLLSQHGKSNGHVLFDGQDLLALPEKEVRRIRGNRMAMIFQEPMTSLNPVMPIGKQIMEVFMRHLDVSKAQAKARGIELLQQVGIPRAAEVFAEYPHQLSGGMRQRVMIAMAIACQPQLLIADEPTTALDVTIQAQILDLLKGLREEMGMSMILITHDLGVVAEMCERVLVMYAGEVIESSDVRTVLRTPKHPYTQGLIRSTPQRAKGALRLNTIAGSVPPPDDLPSGCRFAPRCEQVMDICHERSPELLEMAPGHQCKCWLYAKQGAEREGIL